jgi:hypothetical protein
MLLLIFLISVGVTEQILRHDQAQPDQHEGDRPPRDPADGTIQGLSALAEALSREDSREDSLEPNASVPDTLEQDRYPAPRV